VNFVAHDVVLVINMVNQSLIQYHLGYKLGVNGVITFKNAKLKDVYSQLSPNDIVLETDLV
jgi:Tat protein secretion system quality control protein TatD with DNase activity